MHKKLHNKYTETIYTEICIINGSTLYSYFFFLITRSIEKFFFLFLYSFFSRDFFLGYPHLFVIY